MRRSARFTGAAGVILSIALVMSVLPATPAFAEPSAPSVSDLLGDEPDCSHLLLRVLDLDRCAQQHRDVTGQNMRSEVIPNGQIGETITSVDSAIEAAARAYWPDHPLDGVEIMVVDLPLDTLATAYPSAMTIAIDESAAGHGWFVDPTPATAEEFASGGAAEGKIDLLTVLAHEFGHILGHDDLAAHEHPGDLMVLTLEPGERRSPAAPHAVAESLDESESTEATESVTTEATEPTEAEPVTEAPETTTEPSSETPADPATLDLSVMAGDVTVNIHADGTVSATNGVDLVAPISGIANVIGAAGLTTYLFEDGAGLAGSISGAGGSALDYSAYSTSVQVDIGAGTATGTGGVADLAAVTGGTSIDTLIGPSVDSSWVISGPDTGAVGGVAFASFENPTGAADNEDTFHIGYGGSLTGSIEGGAGGFDTLVVDDGPYSLVESTYTGPDSGHVDLDGIVISYAGLEPVIVNTGSAGSQVYNLTAGIDVASITHSAGNNFSLNSLNASFEDTPFTFTGTGTSVTVNLGAGADVISLIGLGGTSLDGKLTITGGPGGDTFKLDDDWGVGVTLEEAGADPGTDTLDFSLFSDADASPPDRDWITVTPLGSGAVTIAGQDGSTLTLDATNTDFEDLTGANINLTGLPGPAGEAVEELVGGLEDVSTFVDDLADIGGLAASLPLVGGNADVAIAKALDFVEAVDELRFQIEDFVAGLPVVTTDALIDQLNTVFGGLGSSLQHLGAAVLSPGSFDSIVAGEVYQFDLVVDSTSYSVKVDVDAAAGVTSAGNVATVGLGGTLAGGVGALVDAIQAGLAELELVSTVGITERAGRLGFQALGIDVESLSVSGAQDAIARLGFEAGVPQLIDNVQDILNDLGSLNVSLAGPGITLEAGIDGGAAQVLFDVDYRADRTSEFFYDLGEEAQGLGLAFDLQAKVSLMAELIADLQLGLGLSPTGIDFFLNVDELRAGAIVNVSGETGVDLNIGFLSATATADLTLDAGVAVDTTGLQNVTDPTAISLGIGDLTLTDAAGTAAAENFNLSLAISAEAGLGAFAGTGTLTASGSPFDGDNITLSSTLDFDTNFPDFNNLSAAGVVSVLGQLAGYLESLRQSDLISGIDIPFVDGGLDRFLDLADVVSDALLFDEGLDNLADGSDKVITDINSALAAAGLDQQIRAQGDGARVTFLAIDPAVTAFSIANVPSIGGGFGQLGLSPGSVSSGTLELTGSSIAASLGVLTGDAGIRFTVTRDGVATVTDVTLEAALTTDNLGIGDDVLKLLDAANAATFATAQDLATRLSQIVTLGTVNFDVPSRVLTYEIAFTDVPIFSVELPTEFEIDLSPVASIQSDTRLIISGTGGVRLKLGFDLSASPGGSGALSDSTTIGTAFLDNVTVDIKDEPAITAPNAPRTIVGVLDNDASFEVSVNGVAAVPVTVAASATAGNETIGDLLTVINTAIGLTTLSGVIQAQADGNTLRLVAVGGGVTAFTVTTTTADPAFAQLGIQESRAAVVDEDTGKLTVEAGKDAPTLVGRLTGNADFTINVNGGGPVTVNVNKIDTDANRNILDLMSDVEGAIAATSIGAGVVEVSAESRNLLFTLIGAATGSIQIVSGTNAGELGLVGTLDADEADLLITLSDNTTTHRITLDGATTIGAVRSAISTQSSGAVSATFLVDDPATPVNEANTGLVLTDTTAGGSPSGLFRVEMLNGSVAGVQLGIVGMDLIITDPDDVADGKIKGATIGAATVLDRFFIAGNPNLDDVIDGTLTISAGVVVNDITVVNAGGTIITSDSFTFSADHVTKELVIKNVAGFGAGTYTINSVDDVSNEATLSASAGAQGLLGGMGVINTGVQASATFGFIGIDLTGTASIGAKVSLGFNPNASELEDGRLSLQELLDNVRNPASLFDLLAPPVIAPPMGDPNFGGLDLAVSLSAGSADFTALAGSLLGVSPSITITVDSLGDPFAEARFEQSSYTRVDADTFTLAGDFEDELPVGIKLLFDDGSGGTTTVQVMGRTFSAGTTTVDVEKVLPTDPAIDLPADFVTGSVFVLPKVDLTTDGLGELPSFEDLSFADILAAVQALADFLGQFESFGFLDEELPVIDKSVNDLLGFASEFAAVVEEAQNNPNGTLQLLETEINEAIGIDATGFAEVFAFLGIGGAAPDDVLDLSYDTTNDILKLDFNLGTRFSEGLDVGIPGIDFATGVLADLGLGDTLDLSGSAGLQAEGAVLLRLTLGVDLGSFNISDPGAGLFIYDTTGLDAKIEVSGQDIAFRVGLGPFALGIASTDTESSQITLDAIATAGLNPTVFTDNRVSFNTLFGNLSTANFTADLTGSISGVLPVFFPNDATSAGAIRIGGSNGSGVFTASGDLVNFITNGFTFDIQTTEAQVLAANAIVIDVHDVVDAISNLDFSNLDLFTKIFLAIDGLDLVLGSVQGVLDGQIGGFSIPLVGDELARGAGFIGDLRDDVIGPLREAVEAAQDLGVEFANPDKNIISTILFDLLGPAGANLLPGATLGSAVGDFITLTTNLDEYLFPTGTPPTIDEVFIEWDIALGSVLLSQDFGIGFDLGVPGLGLETEGDITLDIEWALNLGFGLSFQDGFYLIVGDGDMDATNDIPELIFDVNVGAPATITGTLAFLEVRATDDASSPTSLGATFIADIYQKGSSGEAVLGQDGRRLSFTELGQMGFVAGVAAGASVNLDLSLGLSTDLIGSVAAGFPKITADFVLDWGLGTRGAGATLADRAAASTFLTFNTAPSNLMAKYPDQISGDAISQGLQLVAIQNISLDLGQFLTDVIGPIVDKVSEFTEPLQPIIDFITAPVPIIGEFLDFTWLDLAAAFGNVDVSLIKQIAEIITLINDIAAVSGATVMIPLGEVTFFDINDPLNQPALGDKSMKPGDLEPTVVDAVTMAGGIDSAVDGATAGDATDQAAKGTVSNLIKNSGTFAFPFLEDPSQIFGLLTGGDIDLVTFDIQPLVLEFEFSQFFTIFGPLGVSIGLNVGVSFDSAVGYDTSGIRGFVESDFRNPLLILDGFFISDSPQLNGVDDPELVFGASLFATAELNLGIARAGIRAELGFVIEFDLFDPNDDGKIRIGELIANVENQLRAPGSEKALAPLAIFDVRGEIFALLEAFLIIDFGFFSFEKDFPIFGPVTLLDFEIDFFRPPLFASEQENGDLVVHTGAFADQRQNGNATDLPEHLIIRSGGSSGGFVTVEIKSGNGALGADSQVFLDYRVKEGRTIYIDGGQGDDTFDLTGFVAANVLLDIDLGGGNDTVLWANGATGVSGSFIVIRGGTGDDNITGSGGSDLIFGGPGNDTINSGHGEDLVFGDDGEIGDTTARGLVSPTDGRDNIDGGEGSDILIGSGQKDTLYGGAHESPDLILGGGGVVFFTSSSAQKVYDSVEALEQDPPDDTENLEADTSAGDILDGGWGEDVILGTAGPDTLIGGGNNDIIFGLGGFDIIDGLEGDDLIFGDDGILQEIGSAGTADGGSSSTRLVDAAATFKTDGLEPGDFVRNLTEGTFVRIAKVLSNTELDTVAVTDWSGDAYSFFIPIPIAGGDADQIQGGIGNDLIFGGDGGDTIQGGDGNDEVRGGSGADVIFGDNGSVIGGVPTPAPGPGDGDDTLFGQGEPDKIFGGGGTDIMDGGAGADEVKGGDGEDAIRGNKGSDVLDGEGGSDTYLLSFQGGRNVSRQKVLDTGSTADIDRFIAQGTIFDDLFLLRANADGSIAFVALINSDIEVERINYFGVERIVVNGSFGEDHFAVDDTAAEVTLNGEFGDDSFQIGQLFRSERGDIVDTDGDLRSDITGVALEDAFATIEVTRGFLSNGISAPLVANGGLGADNFVVFHNRAVLGLNGDEGDDIFEVRAFALTGSQEPQRERTDISGGAGADLVQYAVNAPVNINGGDGFDTLVVIGTEFGDDFVITEDGVFGGGLTVNFVNIESLQVDAAEGNDRFYVKSTKETFITQLFGGLGSDTINMSGDTPPVVSNDLLGHSGIILHSVESDTDARYDEQKLFGISSNVADNDEPFAVIRESFGSTIIDEGSGIGDTYEVVLTRKPDKTIFIKALAPAPTPDERERRRLSFRLQSSAPGAVVTADGTGLTLVFTAANWYVPQTVTVLADNTSLTDIASDLDPIFTRPELGDDPDLLTPGTPFTMNDTAFEGVHFGVINHLVQAASIILSGTAVSVTNGTLLPPTATTVQIVDPGGVTAGDLLGRNIIITSNPGAGQSRFIVAASAGGGNLTLTLDRPFLSTDVPDNVTSTFLINIDDAIVGKMSSFDETPAGLPATSNPDDKRSTFTDSTAPFPTVGEGLTGAILQIIGGPGTGQERLILGNLPGSESSTLILNGPWRTNPVGGESLYRIERYDGLAIPSVEVQINDDDRPGLIIDETDGFEDANGTVEPGDVVEDFDTITAIIEGGDGDHLGENDIINIRLSQDPGGTVAVTLGYDAVQMTLTDLAGTVLDGSTPLTFNSGNWSVFQPVLVSADTDLTREGFHASLIDFVITAGSNDTTAMETDPFETIPSADAVFFVGLTQTPIAPITVTLNSSVLTEAVDVAGELVGDYQILSNKIVFLDGGAPVEVSGDISVAYSYTDPGFTSAFTTPVLARIADADAPAVIVRETDGSTDVVEVKKAASPSLPEDIPSGVDTDLAPWIDFYELVLSGVPSDTVTVTVTPEITKTTRTGGIRHDAVQVVLSKGDPGDARVTVNGDGTLTVVFTAANWDDPVLVQVAAIDDAVVDGGDTKEFAPGPNTVSGILGPVTVEGAAGRGSLSIQAPTMLPGEINRRASEGNVVAFTPNPADGFGAVETMTVETADLSAKASELGFGGIQDLIGRTIEMSDGNGIDVILDPTRPDLLFDRFWMIEAIAEGGANSTLTLRNPSQVDVSTLTGTDIPDGNSEYAITNLSENFFVDETVQVDFMFVHDEDSPADSSGVLTSSRLSGLNMGPDLVIGGQTRPGGITYGDLEVIEINLGTGNNTFEVLGTHVRADGYQTWTFLNTGDDIEWQGVQGDTVTVGALSPDDVSTDTGTVVNAVNAGSGALIFDTTVTIDTPFQDGSLAGQLITIFESDGTTIAATRRILDNTGAVLTVNAVWEFLPTGDLYEVVDERDGSLAINTEGGDDTVNAAASSLGIVVFGGLGEDTLTGGSGNDVIFGDQGRVDYVDFDGAIVTRLGTAPEPITGFVTTDVTSPYTLLTDSAASFPVPDATADGAGTDDVGLVGLYVDINNGKGFLQTPRLITGNTATTLIVAPAFDADLDLPGPDAMAPSEYRISTMPEDQTDGVVRDPSLLITVDSAEGARDIINSGGGDDTIFGGAGNDMINAGADDDTVVGDGGRLDRSRDPGAPSEIVEFNPDAAPVTVASLFDRLRTIAWADGDVDTISGNAGADTILGGNSGDNLYGDDPTGSATTSDLGDLVIGDNGEVEYVDGVINHIFTTDITEATGGADTIRGNAGDDIVLGGVNGSPDVINGDEDDDILLGDNGELIYDDAADPDLATLDIIRSFTDGRGGDDEISGNGGSDTILGGTGGDDIWGDDDTGTAAAADLGDLILGDNGRINLTANQVAQVTTTDTAETTGGSDTISGNAGPDVILGGVGGDTIYGDNEVPGSDDGDDLILGDQGTLRYGDDADLGTLDSVTTDDVGLGGADTIFGDAAEDLILGGKDGDTINAGSEDDLVFGDFAEVLFLAGQLHIARTIDINEGGVDTIFGNNDDDVLVGGAFGDFIDGAAGDDLIFGDAVDFTRRDGDVTNPRFQTLTGSCIYDRFEATTGGCATAANGDVSGAAQNDDIARDYRNPGAGVPWWAELLITDLFHTYDIESGVDPVGLTSFGNDYIAGGPDHDTIFGQLGNDVVQGDGDYDPAGPLVGASRTADGCVGTVCDYLGDLDVDPSFEAATDGDDYIEGNGGMDVVFGGLGQDDILGGSSNLFTLDLRSERPDEADLLFGGAGTRIDRSHELDAGDVFLDERHARDADTVVGDNGNVIRVVGTTGSDTGTFVRFAYDNPTLDTSGGYTPLGDPLFIIPRAVTLLDYTAGGPDFEPTLFDDSAGVGFCGNNAHVASNDVGGNDEIHGESGDDTAYLGCGNDIAFGDSEDDDLIGNWGHDWFSGGTGRDGILGDDGRIYTSRNTTVGEPLYGVEGFASGDLDLYISSPGRVQEATINLTNKLKKAVDITPFNLTPNADSADEPLFITRQADDIIYGGLGDDFLHGASGNDAISGAEALLESYGQDYDSATGDLLGVVRSDWTRPYNAGRMLAFGEDTDAWNSTKQTGPRLGEFALYDEYDPRRVVRLNDDGTKVDAGSGGKEWLLNFSSDEGPVTTAASDGSDVLFGALGNDWLVGGTGNDDLWGGWGNDLLQADDVLGTTGDTDEAPDTDPTYEDRAFGGAGLDILIGNTGGDRLIDWVGEFNSYLVPFAPFGIATVSRQVPPKLYDFLYALSASDGADPSRSADTGNDADRNGEPDGEIGLVTQKDGPLWRDQTGGPSDPQPGNIPGGSRDVLRSADFNGGTMSSFAPDSGTWDVSSGKLTASAASSLDDAAAVFYQDEYVPQYYEVSARVSTQRPTGGWKANAYIIFDYYSPTDFKYAGINVSTNKFEMGHRTSGGWVIDAEANVQVKPDVVYDLLLSVNGTVATLVVDGAEYFTHGFPARIVDGLPYGLNTGMVGLGSQNARGNEFDNVAVQILPPQLTFDENEDFSDGAADRFTGQTAGSWTINAETYTGAPATGETIGFQVMDIGAGLQFASYLELLATISTAGVAGVAFDQYGPEDFKFAAIDVGGGQVVIGHHSPAGGWAIEQAVPWALTAGQQYRLALSLKGASLSVTLDGLQVAGHGFNSAVVDGVFGPLVQNGAGVFDDVRVRTNDPAFDGSTLPGGPQVSVSNALVDEGDAGSTTVTATVSLSEAADDIVTVDYITTVGSATASVDYESANGTVTFGIGEIFADITFTVFGDLDIEGDEDFRVQLSNAVGADIDDGLGVVTIVDDDFAVEPVVTVSVDDADASEVGSDPASFTISRDLTSGVLVVSLGLSGSATEVDDYVVSGAAWDGATDTVTLADGVGSVSLVVTPVADGLVEGAETVTVTVVSGSGYVVGTPDSESATISEDVAAWVGVSVVSVPDVDGDLVDEVGVLLLDPVTGGLVVALRDEDDGSLTAEFTISSAYEGLDLEVTPSGDVAVLLRRTADSQVRVRVISVSGGGVSDYLFGLADAAVDLEVTSTGGLAVLGTRLADSMVRVRVLDPVGGGVDAYLYGTAFTGDVLEVTPTGDLAVLGSRLSDGNVRVRTMALGSGAGSNYLYGKKFTGDDLAVSASGGLAVLGTRPSNGLVRVRMIDPVTGSRSNFYYGRDFSGDALVMVDAVNPAVMGRRASDGQVRVKVMDGATRAPIATYLYGKTYSAVALLQTRIGRLGVLGDNGSTVRVRIQIPAGVQYSITYN